MTNPTPSSMDQRDGWIWLDGQFVPWKDAKCHFLTHSIHYGSAVFEGTRAYGGKIFKQQEHNDRLFASAATLGMKVPFTKEEINAATIETLKKNGLSDAYIRPCIWYGATTMGLHSTDSRVRVGIASWAWPPYYGAEIMEKGIKLTWSQWRRPDPATAPVHAKASGLYMICTMTMNKAKSEGFNDGLMLDYTGHVAECSAANIFFIKDGDIHTPTADRFLNGITRQTVIQMAREKGIKVFERRITPEEIPDMDEAFVTGTAAEVTPVGQIAETIYGVGPITKMIHAGYMAMVNGQES